MPDWTAFGAVVGLVLCLLLGLAWITSGAIGGRRRRVDGSVAAHDEMRAGDDGVRLGDDGVRLGDDGMRPEDDGSSVGDDGSGNGEGALSTAAGHEGTAAEVHDEGIGRPAGVESIPVGTLFANVLFTHGGLGLLVLGGAALTGIPAAALGVEATAWSTGAIAVLGGLAVGGGLATANVALAASLDRMGVDHSEDLRAALAPDSALGWAVLLVVILPLVAGFEELLFRAVLIGAAATATGVSPWLFVVPSSIAFALGHGIQGRGGILVTGLLGGVLGVAFVLTNSLVLVVLAHYVVNAVEFLLKEWLGVDLGGRP